VYYVIRQFNCHTWGEVIHHIRRGRIMLKQYFLSVAVGMVSFGSIANNHEKQPPAPQIASPANVSTEKLTAYQEYLIENKNAPRRLTAYEQRVIYEKSRRDQWNAFLKANPGWLYHYWHMQNSRNVNYRNYHKGYHSNQYNGYHNGLKNHNSKFSF
jgi:hypothetical protein